MKSNRIKKNEDLRLEIILALLIFLPSFYFVIANLFISLIPIYIVTFFLGAISYVYLLFLSPRKFIIINGVFLLVIIYSITVNPDLLDYILITTSLDQFASSKLIFLVFLYFPIFLLLNIRRLNYEFFINRMYIFSLIMLPLLIIANFNRLTSASLQDYMSIAYELVFWIFWCIIGLNNKRNLLPLSLLIIAILSVITGGSRGAVLVLIVFLFFYYLSTLNKKYESKQKQQNRIFAFTVFSTALVLFFFNFQVIMVQINKILNSLGFTSRFLNYLNNSSFLEDQSRITLFNEGLKLINDNIFGYGIYMDRLLISSNQYVHNLFLELLINYGVIFGSLGIISIITFTFIAFLSLLKRNQKKKIHILIFSSVIIYLKFMISGSYLQSTEFALAFGLVINMSIYKKLEHQYE